MTVLVLLGRQLMTSHQKLFPIHTLLFPGFGYRQTHYWSEKGAGWK